MANPRGGATPANVRGSLRLYVCEKLMTPPALAVGKLLVPGGEVRGLVNFLVKNEELLRSPINGHEKNGHKTGA